MFGWMVSNQKQNNLSHTLGGTSATSLSKMSPPRSSYVWCIFNQILEEIHPMTFSTPQATYASGKSCSCWVFSRCSQCTKTALLQLAYLMDASNFTSGIISWGQWRLPINHGDSSNYRKSSANLKWTSVLGTNPLGDILWKHTINIHKHYL